MKNIELVDVYEVWAPCERGEGEAIVFGEDKGRTLIARIVNGEVIYLKEDHHLHKSRIEQSL